jgi:glycosyltransferase involved in cell wall biosynthesis
LGLKIAHVNSSLEVGGAEVLTALLCRLYRERGHEVEAHCLIAEGAVAEALRADGFRVFCHGPASTALVSWRLFKAFRRFRPDVVHCHNLGATLAAVPMAKLAGVPVIVTTRHGLVPPPQPFWKELRFSLTARLCRAVVGVCNATTKNLALAPLADRSRLVTVYNCAAPAFDDGSERASSKHGFTLLWVGRLAAPKDPFTLLRALAATRAAGSDVSVWFVGDGALRVQSERLAAELELGEAVKFWGEQAGVGAFLRAADAFVLTSESEGLPVSLLEALAAGLPALGTDVGAMPEIIERGNCGLLVPVGSVEALSDALGRMARNPVECAAWGRTAKELYLSTFTPERMAEQYLKIYQSGL